MHDLQPCFDADLLDFENDTASYLNYTCYDCWITEKCKDATFTFSVVTMNPHIPQERYFYVLMEFRVESI